MATELEELHVNDTGAALKVTLVDKSGVPIDISGSSTKLLYLRKPGGSSLSKVASFWTDGTDGILYYATLSGDLDQPGLWKIQALVVTPSGSWHSWPGTFRVKGNIS